MEPMDLEDAASTTTTLAVCGANDTAQLSRLGLGQTEDVVPLLVKLPPLQGVHVHV